MKRVIVIGMGPIGIACARAILDEASMELVGLVDLDPEKIGKTLDQCDEQSDETDEECTLRITDRLDEILANRVDIAMLTTTSRFDFAAGLIIKLVAQGVHIVSSCEEMSYPWYRHAALSQQVHDAAKAAGKIVIGTGVNPGFVMDSLAVVCSTVVRRVTAIRCTRRVQAGTRRRALQAKIGAAMTVERFSALKSAGKIGHVGLSESVALLAAGLGRNISFGSVQEDLEPVLATVPTASAMGLIQPGQVAGIHNTAQWQGDGIGIFLDLWMAVGLSDPKDAIQIEGPVQLHIKIPGSIPGDSATVAILINAALNLEAMQPGLRTMLDLPPSGCRGRDRE